MTSYTVEIPQEWVKLSKFMAAVDTMRAKIDEPTMKARLAECRRVDLDNPNGRLGLSEPLQDNYLSMIIEGKIYIGS